MPSTKAIDPSGTPTKPHRRTWWFRGGGGGGAASHTTKKISMDPSNVTPKTNNLRPPSTANDLSSTTMTSATNSANTTNPSSVTGILRKDTKDYDAVVASKRHQEQIKNTSWFCRTKYFQKMCRVAFDAIDSDGSGTMDEKELYAGLLLLHLQLGMYAGPAACRPLSREQVHTVFVKMDTDQSGTLDVLEFQAIMSVLFSNVLLRVIVQWSMTLMIVPWLAQFILSAIVTVITYIANVIANLDEHSAFFNFVELTFEGIMEFIYNSILPNFVKVMLSIMQRGVSMVPVSVWKALPLTILSTVLGIVVVPYCIFQIDFYFQSLADRHHQRQLNRQNKLNGSSGSNSTSDPTNALIYKSKSL